MSGKQGVVNEYLGGSRFINANRVDLSFDEEIAYLNIDKNPLLLMMQKIKKTSVTEMLHTWQTMERKSDFVANTVVGGSWNSGSAASGTLTVSTSYVHLFSAGDIFMLPAASPSRTFYVDSVDQATGVITARTVDASGIDLSAAAADTYNLFLISNSFEEGSGMGTIKTEQPSEQYNYVQIAQTPVGITTTGQKIAYRGISEWDRIRFEAGIDHAFKMEKNLFFGQRKVLDTGLMLSRNRQYFMGGLTNYISTNVTTDANGVLTQTEFTDWMIDWTHYAEMPACFVGDIIFEALTTWAETSLLTSRTETALGMAVSKFVTPYGKTVTMIPHRELLVNDFAGWAFGVDVSDLEYLYLQGLDTHMATDIQTPDYKQKIDEWRTWMSMKVGNEKRHGLLKGVTSIGY